VESNCGDSVCSSCVTFLLSGWRLPEGPEAADVKPARSRKLIKPTSDEAISFLWWRLTNRW
jgi:ferredoxin